jgi:bifunctional DNA-binding transcriptional regulator/antitoxin component of YhaV-PrlF toxin-antitoxin module
MLTSKVSKFNKDYAIVYLPEEIREHMGIKVGDRIQFQPSVQGGQKVTIIGKAPEKITFEDSFRAEFDF